MDNIMEDIKAQAMDIQKAMDKAKERMINLETSC